MYFGVPTIGSSAALPSLIGQREPRWIELRYQRAGKLERNLLANNYRGALKRTLLHLCELNPEARRIAAIAVISKTPTPAKRREGATATIRREKAREVKCPR